MKWILLFLKGYVTNRATEFVQMLSAQLKMTSIPQVLSDDRAEVEYSINRSMSPTMVAEYKRKLIPREEVTKSLAEYCTFLKTQYK